MSHYELAKRARQDLDQIWDHIADDSERAARKTIERLVDTMVLIAEMPGIGRRRDELAPGLLSFTVAPYLIIYREHEDHVEVLRVVHGSTKYERLFS